MSYYKFTKDKDRNCDIFLFTNKKIYEQIEDDSLKQLFNASKLPEAARVIGMPDIHIGYGLPIGGILAVNSDRGIVSPGAVGFDINCGVRLLTTNLNKNNIKNDIKNILHTFKKQIPAGLGEDSNQSFSQQEFTNIIEKGVPFLVDNFGFGSKKDLKNIEDNGVFPGADIKNISSKAINRGITQLGSLGSGNHFVELQFIEKVFDNTTDFKEGQITVMIHTGSRGFGHQIAKDYIGKAVNNNHKYNIDFPVKNLASFPINSKEGKNYLSAMACAANFAYANRHLLTYEIRKIFKNLYFDASLDLFYDLTHNIARFEDHIIDDEKSQYLIHRKGATRLKHNSFALLPGSMGTASYVIKSANSDSTQKSLTSIAHGSGRVMGRREAKRSINKSDHEQAIKEVEVVSSSGDNLLDESPLVYKNIDDVLQSMIDTKLAYPVARLKPLAVLKG